MLLIFGLKQTEKRRRALVNRKSICRTDGHGGGNSHSEGKNTTLMLVVILVVFLAVEIPMAVILLVYTIQVSAIDSSVFKWTYLNLIDCWKCINYCNNLWHVDLKMVEFIHAQLSWWFHSVTLKKKNKYGTCLTAGLLVYRRYIYHILCESHNFFVHQLQLTYANCI